MAPIGERLQRILDLAAVMAAVAVAAVVLAVSQLGGASTFTYLSSRAGGRALAFGQQALTDMFLQCRHSTQGLCHRYI